MDNIARDLRKFETEYGELIEAIVVGKHSSRWLSKDLPLPDENVVLSRDAGLAKLDREDNSGRGEGFPMYAWTASYIFFIVEYQGATTMACLPRNPIACAPETGGENPYWREHEKRISAEKP